MNDINLVCVSGRLTRDIDVRYLQNAAPVGTFALATNKSVKKNGSWTEDTSFIDITIYGKLAEVLKPYLTKGKKISVTGAFRQDRWEKNGQKFSKIVVIADKINFLETQKTEGSAPAPQSAPQQMPPQPEYSNDGTMFPEDIPF